MFYKNIFIIALIIIFRVSVLAGECPVKGTTIFYSNGMFNTHYNARRSADALEALDVSEIEPSSDRIKYKLAFNENESKIINVLKVVKQKINDKFTLFWRYLAGLDSAPDWLLQAMTHEILISNIGDDNFFKIMGQYEDELNLGQRVLIVSHSQGNIYTRDAFEAISEFKSEKNPMKLGMGDIMVATPILNYANFPWVSFADDQIVKLARTLSSAAPPNLPAIGAGLPPYRDPVGHNFILAYLNTPESRELIRSNMISMGKRLKYPERYEVAMRIQIDTPINYGFEISLQDPKGGIATFDRGDSKEGKDYFGFENICSRLIQGRYVLHINPPMFASSFKWPVIVNIQAEIGTEKKTLQIRYNKAADTALNNDGKLILYVDVKDEGSGGYSFAVKSDY